MNDRGYCFVYGITENIHLNHLTRWHNKPAHAETKSGTLRDQIRPPAQQTCTRRKPSRPLASNKPAQ